MSEFDDNPFADPNQINPFSDPSVQQVTEPPPSSEEYNPFAEELKKDPPKLPSPPTQPQSKAKQKKQSKPPQPQRPPPPVIDPSPPVLPTEPPPSYTPAPTAFNRNDDELKKREDEIARRESELREKEKNLSRLGSDARPRNFPPLPKFCPCQPCFYINIGVEIPPSERWKMRSLLALLFTYIALLLINVIVSIPGIYYASDDPGDKADLTSISAILITVFGIIWLFLFPVLALFCWFMPVYTAYRKDSSLAYMWFFFILVIQCAVWLVLGLGPPGFSAGIISGVGLINRNNVVGGMFLILGFLWLCLIPWAGIMIYLVHRYYRSTGGSLDKAAGEAAKGAAGNKYVRDAVKGGVKAGVSATLSSGNE